MQLSLLSDTTRPYNINRPTMIVGNYGFDAPIFMLCEETGLPYERVHVNTKEGVHKTKEWVENMAGSQ